MNIQKINIQKLKLAKYNPRKGLTKEDEEWKKIQKSIEEFGYVEPIIVNKDGTIIGGHQRYKVLKELGYTEIECNIVDLDETKERALNIALNKINGEWDYKKLEDLMNELVENNYDLMKIGFNEQEINDMINELDVKDEDFLQGTEIVKEKQCKKVTCPECGCEIKI